MSKKRAELGFGDTLDNINLNDWKPSNPKLTIDRPKKDDTAKVAAAAGFRSREPSPILQTPNGVARGKSRRRRTGRNAQFNLKAKPETIEAYCAIADKQGWGLGETLEHAVALLEEKLNRPPRP